MSRCAYKFPMISKTQDQSIKKNFLNEGYLILNRKEWHNCYYSFLNLLIKDRISHYNYYDNWKQYPKKMFCSELYNLMVL